MTAITVAQITMTSYAAPSQWEGETVDGEEVYVRYRHGTLTIEVGGDDVYGEVMYGHEQDSCIDYEQLKRISPNWITWPEVEA